MGKITRRIMVFKKGNKPWNKGVSTTPWNEGIKCPQISKAQRGRVPWNKGLNGVQSTWNKGKEMSEETKRKLSKSRTKTGVQLYRRITKENFPKICYQCYSQKNLIVYHIDVDRYNNYVGNLVIVCRSCHKRIHDKFKRLERLVGRQWEKILA